MPEKYVIKHKPIITDLTFFTNEPDQTLLDRFKVTIEQNTRFFDVLVGFFKTSGFFKLYESLEMLDADAKLLTDGEPIQSHELFNRLSSKKLLIGEDEEEESELKYLKVVREIRDNDPDLFERIKRLPKKARTARKINIPLAPFDKGEFPISPNSKEHSWLDTDFNAPGTIPHYQGGIQGGVTTFFRKGKLRKIFSANKQGVEEVDFFRAVEILKAEKDNDAERQALNDFTYFGTYEDAEKKCLDVLTVELKSSSKVERARSLQRNLIGKYLKTNLKDSALVAFYSKDNPDWRLSFVKMDYKLDERGVKVEIGTPPKRYSFLVGKIEPSHTAQKQLLPLLDDRKVPSLDEIERAFSIEKVTKEFYTEIAKKFTELVGGERKIGSKKIVEAGQLKYPKPSDTLRKEFAVRLIGRLMFCWFLKKKKSDGGVPLIPNVLLSSDAISQYIDYYHSLLEPLFFQVLNTPVEKRNKSVRHSFWNVEYMVDESLKQYLLSQIPTLAKGGRGGIFG